jgi:hypothetical protein
MLSGGQGRDSPTDDSEVGKHALVISGYVSTTSVFPEGTFKPTPTEMLCLDCSVSKSR